MRYATETTHGAASVIGHRTDGSTVTIYQAGMPLSDVVTYAATWFDRTTCHHMYASVDVMFEGYVLATYTRKTTGRHAAIVEAVPDHVTPQF